MATKSAAKAGKTSSRASTKTAAKKAPAKKASAKPITVIGTLTDEGVECQAMREDKTRKLFTLIPQSKLKGFSDGDHVRVTGTIAEVSICQQGTTVVIKTIRRVK